MFHLANLRVTDAEFPRYFFSSSYRWTLGLIHRKRLYSLQRSVRTVSRKIDNPFLGFLLLQLRRLKKALGLFQQ